MAVGCVGQGWFGLVGQREQQLCQTTLSRCIVSQNWRESRVAKRFRQTLAERLSSAGVIGESVNDKG